MTGQLDQRRRFRRVPLNLLVQYRFNTLDDFTSEYACDISEGGMFVHCDDSRESGTLVYLQFALKDGTKLVEGLGRVVHHKEVGGLKGIGIEFVNFDDDAKRVIENIVKNADVQEVETPTMVPPVVKDLF